MSLQKARLLRQYGQCAMVLVALQLSGLRSNSGLYILANLDVYFFFMPTLPTTQDLAPGAAM